MVAAGYPLEAAQVPGGRKIGVQYQGPVQQGDAGVQIAAEVAKRMAASRERHRVVPAQFHCPPGQPGAFRRLLWAIGHPRSEEHTSELQSLMRISYAVFCL